MIFAKFMFDKQYTDENGVRPEIFVSFAEIIGGIRHRDVRPNSVYIFETSNTRNDMTQLEIDAARRVFHSEVTPALRPFGQNITFQNNRLKNMFKGSIECEKK